ncbi:MAG: sensor histidine kinase [Methanomicrobiales archaeon HGW-Methanomicrobiales-5]|nr:MAG: sensor histidine kinase [Methanomicrobiales archaeon HGW-Methanomicrobiales-5]
MSEQLNEAGVVKYPSSGNIENITPAERTDADVKKELEFALKKLEIVGSITRHDVLNQLTAIVGYTELLEMMVEDPQQRSFIEKEKQAFDKIRRQFRFAKDYQMIGVEPPRWHVLKMVIHQAIEAADLKGIAVTDLTGGVSVYADTSFEKVFTNLFENTRRHGGTATEIRISLIPREDAFVLVVEDNGAGIAADGKTKIFGRGYGKGTGWGLFLVLEILAFTGMTITETGEPGKGTRFEIRIPQDHVRMDGGNSQAPPHQ